MAPPTAAALASIKPGSAAAYWMALRVRTLLIAVTPVLVGTALAAYLGGFAWLPALAALVGAVLIQIGTNLANDVFDFEKGADRPGRLGPPRVTQCGLLTPAQVRAAMWTSLGLAAGVGVYLAYVGGWPIIVLGLCSIASAIAYTGGPWPLGYNGLGDLFVMLFFGFAAVCGTVYVQMGQVPAVAWLAALPVGALATAVLVVNNTRDHETDVGAGKRTLVVRFGRRFGVLENAALLALAHVATASLALLQLAPWAVLLALLTAPWAMSLARALNQERGAALNARLFSTVKLLFVHGALLALGFVIGRQPGGS